MRKIVLCIMLFLGIFPRLHHGSIKLIQISYAHASSFSDEDDPDDPDDPYDPDDPDDPDNPDCSNGYTENYTFSNSLNGNITTTVTCFDVYDGCGNFEHNVCGDGIQCGISSAGISLSETTGNYHDDVVLTASASIIGSPIVRYEFQQSSDGGNSWEDVGNDSTSNSFSYSIDEYGQNEFRVIESCSCSISVTSNVAIFTTNMSTCVSNVSLTLSAASGKLGDQITLSASATTTGSPTLEYTYEVCYNNNGDWTGVATLVPDKTHIYTVNLLGEIDFRLNVYATCLDGSTSNIYSVVIPFVSSYCSSDFLTQSQSQMTSLWNTAVAAQKNSPNKMEYGFALNWNGSEFEYDNETTVSNPCDGSDTTEILANTTYPTPANNPIYGETYTVGNYHTHPTLSGCSSDISLVQGPSSIDNGVKFPCPAFVGAYNTYSISGGNSGNWSLKLYPYGVDCCTYDTN